MKSYVILGCNKSLTSILDIISIQNKRVKKIVCQDTKSVIKSSDLDTITVESFETFIPEVDDLYLCGLAGKQAMLMYQQISENTGISFDVLIHPRAYISLTANIFSGSIILAGAIIASNVMIGEFCFVGQGAIFGHDTILESYAVIQSGAKLAGHVRVGKAATIGMGATILEDVSIGDYSIVEPGAVVLRDVPPFTIVSGIPAIFKQAID